MREPPFAIVAFDPAGDGEDENAVALYLREEFERGERHEMGFEHQMIMRLHLIETLRQDLEFPEVLASMLRLYRWLYNMKLQGRIYNFVIVVETNGVGHGYYHSLRNAIGGRVYGQYTVGGDHEKPINEEKLVMPRMAGLDHFRYCIETHTIKIARDPASGQLAQGADKFRTQMNSFVWKGPKRPQAMEGQKDDLIMAGAIGNWFGTKVLPTVVTASAMTRKDAARKRAA